MRNGWMFTVVAAVAVGLLVPAPAQADNTTAANAEPIMVGQVVQGSVSTTRNEWFKASLQRDRSYALRAWLPYLDDSEDAAGQIDIDYFREGGTVAFTGRSDLGSGGEPPLAWSGIDGENGSIVTTSLADCPATTCNVSLNINSFGTVTPVQSFAFVIVETTLFSPYFAVNTAAGYDAAPQIKNNTDQTLSITLIHRNQVGSLVCRSTHSLGAYDMLTYGISGPIPGCSTASAHGSMEIIHNGLSGAISANITTFSGAAALSFDAPFNTRTGYDQPWGEY